MYDINACFTETFETFLTDHESEQAWQAIVTKFSEFPAFTLTGTSYNMYALFRERYLTREIGAEDEGIFTHHITDILNRNILIYVPKINQYITEFNNVLKQYVEIESSGENGAYLYPVNSTNKRMASGTDYTQSHQEVIAKNMNKADMLEAMMNLRNVYIECVDAFDICFMEIY